MKFSQSRIWLIVLPLVLIMGVILMVNTTPVNNTLAAGPESVKDRPLILHTSEFPKSFNYFVNNSSDAANVFGLIYETLMEMKPNSLEFQPLIAKSCEISADKKEFTVTIDPRAKWNDGQPITTDDIKFTYDTVMNPNNLTSVQRLFLGRFNPPVIIDKYTIKFTAKTVHYNNFVTLVGLNVLPKHLFSGKDFNKGFNMSLPPGSGPYILSEVREGRYFVLKRRSNYWADQLPSHKGMYNFASIKYVVMNTKVAYEAFKKGDFDFYDEISAKRWVTETDVPQFQKNWIVKQKVYNYAPQGFSGIAFNMRRPLFQGIKVREAICHLLDRNYLLEKIMYNQYQPLTSYFPSIYGTAKSNELIKYDPAKAKQLLKEAGFTKLDKEGYLINLQGERLEFTLLYVSEDFDRHMTYFAETCKQAGVKVNLQLLSWATLIKRMENYDFDALNMGWSTSLFEDPEQLWHSRHINEPGGSNVPGYKNDEVDKLIDSMPAMFDAAKRTEILKQIDRLIYKEYPYALFWGANYTKIFYKNIFGMPKTVFSKYSSNDMIAYWWFDPVKIKRYEEAVKKNQALPKEPEKVEYDSVK